MTGDEDILADLVRRAALVHAMAERALGIAVVPGVPLDGRLDAVLEGAMANPSAIDGQTYKIIHALRYRSGLTQGDRNDCTTELG